MEKLLYGVAYYDEYMPYDRLDQDIRMMKDAGINIVRIADSTWGTYEPQNGVFDFSSVEKVLTAMYLAGIHVIVATPTYAVPTWMVKEHPDILAITPPVDSHFTAPGRTWILRIRPIFSTPSGLFGSWSDLSMTIQL